MRRLTSALLTLILFAATAFSAASFVYAEESVIAITEGEPAEIPTETVPVITPDTEVPTETTTKKPEPTETTTKKPLPCTRIYL